MLQIETQRSPLIVSNMIEPRDEVYSTQSLFLEVVIFLRYILQFLHL